MEGNLEQELRSGEAKLWRNRKKKDPQKDAKLPDFTGRIRWHNGTEAWLSAWENTSGAGNKWLKLNIGDYITPHSEHDQAKANGYQPQSLDVDAGVPF